MKLTKTQLRKIIKEELAKTISEYSAPGPNLPPGYPLDEFVAGLQKGWGKAIADHGFETYRQKLREAVVFTLLQDKKSPYYLGGDGSTESMDELKSARVAVLKHVMQVMESGQQPDHLK
jgi:hypothetical protein